MSPNGNEYEILLRIFSENIICPTCLNFLSVVEHHFPVNDYYHYNFFKYHVLYISSCFGDTIFSHEWQFNDLSNSVTSTTVCDMSVVLLGILDVVSQVKSSMVSLSMVEI